MKLVRCLNPVQIGDNHYERGDILKLETERAEELQKAGTVEIL